MRQDTPPPRILTHRTFLLFTQKNHELSENLDFFLIIQKPSDESSVLFE